MQVSVVTVTYGNRWPLLEQTLRAAFDEGCSEAFVIDNESTDSITERVAEEFGERAQVTRFEENQGSSIGYHKGIERAVECGAEWILLLDDDNRMEPGCIKTMAAAVEELQGRVGLDRLCVAAYRPLHHQGALRETIHDSESDFFSFHLKDLGDKLRRHLLPGTVRRKTTTSEAPVRVRYAMFGGMLLHRSVVERIGLPNEQFILYCDDYEYSYRISSRGGEIWILPKAIITDTDATWQVAEKPQSSFDRWLSAGNQRQVYYVVRNQGYFETHCRQKRLMWRLNRAAYLTIFFLVALGKRNRAGYRLFRRALRDGEAGRLGVNEEFPLPRPVAQG
jgi:GT2 family glycosyltransferase